MTRDDMLDCLHHNAEDLRFARGSDYSGVEAIEMAIKILEQPETCDGCKHKGKWENQFEYEISPCKACKRNGCDNYETN